MTEYSFMADQDSGDSTKQRILDAALAVFSARGYGNSSIPVIAQEARMASGTIYNHFKDKADLVNQLFRQWKDRKLQSISFGIPEETPRERFRKAIRSYLDFGVAHGSALLFLEAHYHAAYLDDESVRKSEQVVERFLSFVETLISAGALRPDPAALHLAILNGACLGVLRQIWSQHLEPTEQLLAQTEVAIWSALRA